MCFRQVLAICALALYQIWDGVEPECVHAHVEPELHHIPYLFADGWIVPVQIRLMAEKSMPVILFGDWVPCPVGKLGIHKDDARSFVAGIGIAPHVPVAA